MWAPPAPTVHASTVMEARVRNPCYSDLHPYTWDMPWSILISVTPKITSNHRPDRDNQSSRQQHSWALGQLHWQAQRNEDAQALVLEDAERG